MLNIIFTKLYVPHAKSEEQSEWDKSNGDDNVENFLF